MIKGNSINDVLSSTLSVLKGLLVTVAKVNNVDPTLEIVLLIVNFNFLNYHEFNLMSTAANYYHQEACCLIRYIITVVCFVLLSFSVQPLSTLTSLGVEGYFHLTTHSHTTTVGRTPLDEGSAVAETST